MRKFPRENLLDRELSWLEFNSRVLAEGTNPANPLLERVKFMGIVSSNLDEFFMVRIPSIKSSDPLLPQIKKNAYSLLQKTHEGFACIIPLLEEKGIRRLLPEQLNEEQHKFISNFFQKELFPILTPIGLTNENSMPVLTNLQIYIVALLTNLKDPSKKQFALIEIPRHYMRLVTVPSEHGYVFMLIEDIVGQYLHEFFAGYEVTKTALMRLTRAAELTLDEEKDEDFFKVMTDALKTRKQNVVVRLETNASGPMLDFLKNKLEIDASDACVINDWLDLKSISQLSFLQHYPELKNRECSPKIKYEFKTGDDIWRLLKERDVCIHHPYESFETIIRFVQRAAEDPDVLAIKQTLYRVGHNSPILRALEKAAERGKHVTVLIELKARFDEYSNMEWAKRLERAGAIVLYGVAHLKTHAKTCLVVRSEPEGIKRYVHLSTGNYNERTARLYSDVGFFTSDDQIGGDISAFFNMITGVSEPVEWSKIDVAPFTLRRKLIRLILREGMTHSKERPGLIMAKLNSLVDPDIIEALYRASKAGVQIKLNVRGICCLKPGLVGLSENIEVVSIVDMFLEHSRIFYFFNGGDEELYLSSADWMPRNLDRRIELMFPIDDKAVRDELLYILSCYFKDNVKGWTLLPDGTYRRRNDDGKKPFRVQEYFVQRAGELEKLAEQHMQRELKPQRPKRLPESSP